jgi:hypothetical protein
VARSGFLKVACVVVLLARVASAEEEDAATRSAARSVALEGIEVLQKGDPNGAVQKLEKAYQVLKVPTIALWSARALVAAGRLVEASERYLAASRLPSTGGDRAIQEQAQADAARELERLVPRIPTLLITVAAPPGSELSVSLDGKPLPLALLGEPRPVNPGTHQLVVSRPGVQQKRGLSLSEGQREHVTFSFGPATGDSPAVGDAAARPGGSGAPAAPSAAEEKHGPPALAVAAFVGAGLGVGVGAVSGVLALNQRQDLENNPNCRGDECLPAAQAEVDSFRTLRTTSSIGFIAGGVLAATGVVLVLTASPSRSSRSTRDAGRLALRAGLGQAAIEGHF